MATSNTILGPVSLAPRGEYDPAAQYTYLDLVRYNGSGYLVLRSIQGVTPVDGADYMLITERGGIGATGETGPQGEQGIQGVQGEKGETGNPGSSIAGIERTVGTGAPGTRDTYTITLTDGSTSSFEVYNGADGIGAGDMTAAIYDPQGKAQDIFKYVDDHTQPDAVTVPGGGEIEMEESLGEGPHTFEFTPEEDGSAVQASQVGYESTESGLEAETVQAALDQLSTIKADVGRVSNGNLLDNWYFPDPINQRGQTEYTGSGYTIDRWRSTNENLSTIILSDGIQLLTPANASGSGYFRHYFENPLPPGIYTYSALVRGTGSGFMNVTDEPAGSFFGPNAVIANPGEAWTLTTGTFLSTDTTKIRIAYFRCNAGSSFDIKAAKLELGPVQTLAHQDADGNWVLNDPPPNKALELAKCQRYQVDTNTEQSPFALTAVSTNMLFGSIVFATSMRIKPAVNGLTLRKIKDGQLTQVTGFALQGTTDGIFAITKIAPSTLIAGEMYQIMASFDANL